MVRAGEAAIAPAVSGDLPDLAELMAASPLLRRYGTTRAAALAVLEQAWQARDLLLTGRAAGRPPIALAWVIRSRALAGAAYLRLLLVAEGVQRAGLGARLLAEAEARAREWANHMTLLATADNAAGRRFYERQGYRFVGTFPELARPGLDEALYWKPLRPHAERLAL